MTIRVKDKGVTGLISRCTQLATSFLATLREKVS